MTKRTLALRCSFLVGCVLFLVDLPVAISQEVAVSTPTYTLKLSSGPPLPGTTNSAPLTNITFQTTQTITNASNGPVWQTAWTVQGTNGLISVFAQTTTSVRTTMSLSPPSSLTASDTTSGASMELARPHTEDLLSSPPACGDPDNPDSDNDGLPDSVENCIGTDPYNPDTDGDGYTDLQEIVLGTDPFLSCNYPSIPPYLAGWWTFDETTGTLASDASGNLQTGVLEGTPNPTWVTNGVANGALSFDGSNSFLVTPATAMFCNLSTQLTVSAWINARNQLFGGGPPLVKWNGYADDQFGYSDDADACGFTLEFHDPSNVWFLVYSSDLGTWIGTPLAPVPTNQWTHVVGTYDGSAVRIYTNGALAGSTVTNIGNITTCGTDLSIGNDLVNFDRFYNGLIDDVRVYYTALGTGDVYAVYKMDTDHDGLANIDEINVYHTNPNLFDSDGDGYGDGQEIALGSNPTNSASQPVGVPPYLLGWWKFLDGSGAVDVDSSSNRMGGDLVNSPSWIGSGVIGGALQFDGSTSYVTNPVTTLSVLTTQLTIAVWINTPNQGSLSASPIMKWNECTEEGDIGGFTMEFSGSTNVLFYLYSTSAQNWIPAASTATTSNTWTHLGATYDGSNLRIYKNGEAVASPAAFTDSVNFCVAPLTVAHDLINDSRYLTGQLADVRVYNKALGSNDMFAIYNTDSLGDGIPNWWRQEYFGNGTTTNVYSCASCTSTNPFAHGLTNLQLYENPSVLISNNYTTLNDGIPDWWKVTYGFSLTDTNVASADSEGDGLTNLQKYQLGLDPFVSYAVMMPSVVLANSSGNSASIPEAGAGASYSWTIANGTIDSGSGTTNVSWTAGGGGVATLSVQLTTSGGSVTPNGSATITPCSLPTTITVPISVIGGSTNTASLPNSLTTLVNFTNGVDGTEPFGLLQGTRSFSNFFYGSTGGGTNFYVTIGGVTNPTGSLFKMTPQGTLTTVWMFSNNTQGRAPMLPVQGAGSDSNFYGVATQGGPLSNGTVFAFTPQGLTNLFVFNGSTQGQQPKALTLGRDGNLYGVTVTGGSHGDGLLFMISTNLNGGAFTVLHNFAGNPDGINPEEPLVQGTGTDNNFYGTAPLGGTDFACLGGCGTIFKLVPQGTNSSLTNLHVFVHSDGGQPSALTLGADGKLYGTTGTGGNSNHGTVFQMTTGGAFTNLYHFNGGLDGTGPGQLVQAVDGNFYGTTIAGGLNDEGTVFRITPQGTFTTVYQFSGNDGIFPGAHLSLGTSNGFLYGVCEFGGTSPNCYPGCGTVFQVNPATYVWSITNGTIIAGQGTPNITWTAGTYGSVTVMATVTVSSVCTNTLFTTVPITAINEWYGPFNSWTNLTAFGALGGTNDDTSYIATAIASIATSGCSPVLVLTGMYNTAKTIYFANRSGGKIVNGNTNNAPAGFRWIGGSDTTISGTTTLFHADCVADWKYDRLTFDGNGKSYTLFSSSSQSNTEAHSPVFDNGNVYQDCSFINPPPGGIGLVGGWFDPSTNQNGYGFADTTVERCIFTNFGAAILTGNQNALDCWVTESYIANCATGLAVVAGSIHAFHSSFVNNGTDITYHAAINFSSAVSNTSYHSYCFYNNDCQSTLSTTPSYLRSNVGIDNVGPMFAIGISGPIMFIDNLSTSTNNPTVSFYSTGGNQTQLVNVVAIGNTNCFGTFASYSSFLPQNRAAVATKTSLVDNGTVNYSSLTPIAPSLPVMATNLQRPVVEMGTNFNVGSLESAVNSATDGNIIHVPWFMNNNGTVRNNDMFGTVTLPTNKYVIFVGDGFNSALSEENSGSLLFSAVNPCHTTFSDLQLNGDSNFGPAIQVSGVGTNAARVYVRNSDFKQAAYANVCMSNCANALIDFRGYGCGHTYNGTSTFGTNFVCDGAGRILITDTDSGNNVMGFWLRKGGWLYAETMYNELGDTLGDKCFLVSDNSTLTLLAGIQHENETNISSTVTIPSWLVATTNSFVVTNLTGAVTMGIIGGIYDFWNVKTNCTGQMTILGCETTLADEGPGTNSWPLVDPFPQQPVQAMNFNANNSVISQYPDVGTLTAATVRSALAPARGIFADDAPMYRRPGQTDILIEGTLIQNAGYSLIVSP